MMKKIVVVFAILLMLSLCVSTCSSSLVLSKERIRERITSNTAFQEMLERISQIIDDKNDDDESIEDDGDVDDGMVDNDDDQDGLIEDVLLPKEGTIDGEWTPDNGDAPVVEKDDVVNNPTVDENGLVGASTDEVGEDVDGAEGTTNEVTVVTDGTDGAYLKRIIDVIVDQNGELGAMLQIVRERTFAAGTTESTEPAENIVDNVVIEGGEVGTSTTDESGIVVVSDNE